jgi:hypothetical protein
MTNSEIRADVAQGLLGASIALGLIIDGLRGRVEPDALSDGEHAALHQTLGFVSKVVFRGMRDCAMLELAG